MASTTKIMTALLALESNKLNDVVIASKKAAGMPKVHLGMQPGRQYYMKDLLYSLMLESHNDTAVAIAEHLGGSVSGFAAKMNQKANFLACLRLILSHQTDSTQMVITALHRICVSSLPYAIKKQRLPFSGALGSVIYSYSNKAMWDSCNVQVYIYIHLYIKYKI